MVDLKSLARAIIEGKAPLARDLTLQALAEGLLPSRVLNEGLVDGMNTVGLRFKNNEFYVPEVLIAARAIKYAMDVLRPALANTSEEPVGRIVIGTVKGDLHDIGKNIVTVILLSSGFDDYDLGTDVKSAHYVNKVRETGAEILGLSALLTTTMLNMGTVIEDLKKAGLRERVKVIIGGQPTSQEFA